MIRSFLKNALPRGIVRIVRDLGRVDSGSRTAYLRLAWRGGRRKSAPASLARHQNVVMVCHGNILRSAFAEVLLRQEALAHGVRGINVSSAGIHAVPGKVADPRGVAAAREWGVDLAGHHATRLDAAAVAAADLILVMDLMNAAEVTSKYPASADKVFLLGEFDPAWKEDPIIPDPYTGDVEEVRSSYGRVVAAVRALVAGTSTS